MSSPCPPRTNPVMSFTERFNSCAMNVRKRAVSNTPDWPITRSFGNPASLNTEYVIASTGFVNTTIIAFGEYFAMSRVILFIILEFVATKSSRLIPGLRAIPAVITTTSESAVSA
ncbi:Uncharacterised protein [Streptococcus pneumoniae]|nr:Uncharacterised protein [Streptococcus pneumoniae]